MLKGVRVLDLSRLLPGPYATMLLGDMGAEVIKIEEPGRGDYMREFIPLVKKDSAFFLAANRNKKSVTLNLKSAEGREIFFRLAGSSDVIIESFRPGVVDALGIGYEAVKEINSGIVYCSLTGYGQTGHYRQRAGHDINYLATSGVLSVNRQRGGAPVMPGIQMADLTGALYAVIGVLSGLWRQQREGKGSYIDAAMTDGLVSISLMPIAYQLATGRRNDNMLSGALVRYNIYLTADNKYVALGALEDKFWQAFCLGLGREDLLPGFMALAVEGDPVFEAVKEIFKSRTKEQWAEFAGAVDCCLSPVEEMDEVLSGDYAAGRKLALDIMHPVEGLLTQVRNPLQGDVVPVGATPPPVLGQHTMEILEWLGYQADEINSFRDKGVV
ncbi:MAG: CaiB/BaiF CoA-transferase family protein [Bacillota bacterium]